MRSRRSVVNRLGGGCLRDTRIVLILVLAVLAGCADQARALEPRQTTLTLKSETFSNTRTLRVLLPPSYDEETKQSYPVFYFTDGIAAWDAWGVDEVAKSLWTTGEIPELIFVGIDNGGSTEEATDPARDRAREYLPYPDQAWVASADEAKAHLFPQFLFDEVMPLIASEFRVDDDPSRTGLAGSSYGAVVSLYTAMQHPDRIGYLLLESPSLQVGEGQLLVDAREAGRWPRRVYIGVGTAEGDTPEGRQQMVEWAKELYTTVSNAPDRSENDQHLEIAPDAPHWYDAWNARLPIALRFLTAGKR